MKFSAKLISNSPTFVIPAKTALIFGDPCYHFFGDFQKHWGALCDVLNRDAPGDCHHVEITVDGTKYLTWIAGTAHGDGCFNFQWKIGKTLQTGRIGVDAGMLSIFPTTFPGTRKEDDMLFAKFTTGPRPTKVDIRGGSWCTGRFPICITG
jgi:hypothetical protein